MSTVGIILISAASGIGVAAFIYGLIRKASRVSWLGWQVLILFALTFLLDVIPLPEDIAFWITAGVFLGALGLDLLLGGIIRSCIMRCETPGKHAVRWSRFFGGVCALVNAALLFGVIASVALPVCGAIPGAAEFLAPVYESAVWQNFLSRHIYDLFIITACFLFVRMGLRVGLVRALYYLLMLALTFASLLGAILLATQVDVIAGWGAWLGDLFAGWIPSLLPAGASVLGHGVFALLFFAVLFAVVMLFGWLLHKGLRRALDCRTFGMISAILLFLLFLAVFLAFMCGLYYGVRFLLVQNMNPLVTKFAEYMERLFTSSPLSAAFYWDNPFLLFLP